MSNPIQNFFKATITNDWSIGTGVFYISIKPTTSSGRLVISPSSDTLREIIEYTSTGTDGNGDYIVVSVRGVGNTTEQTHTVGEKIRMNITAEDWEDMRDDIDSIVAGGAVNASTVQRGISQLSTNAQAKNGTTDGDTTAKLIPSNSNASMVKRSTAVITAGGATPTLDIDNYDRFVITPDSDITSVNVTGTPIDGQRIDIQTRNTSGQKNIGLVSIATDYLYTSSIETLSVSKPVGTLDGDIMFAMYSSSGGFAITIPTGWTRIAQQNSGHYFELFYKVATSSEPTNYTWTMSGSQTFISIETKRGGFNLVNPIESFSSVQYITYDNLVKAGTVTTTKDNQYVLIFSGFYNTSSTTFTPPTNYTETFDTGDTTPDLWHENSFRLVPTAGSTGELTTTSTTVSSNKHSFAVVLNKDVYSLTLGSAFQDLSSVYSNGMNNYELEYNSILLKWIQRSNKSNINTCGTTTYDLATASGTQTIPHNLGRTPKVVRIKGTHVNGTTYNSTSYGIYSNGINSCIYLFEAEGSSTAQADTAGNSSIYSLLLGITYSTSDQKGIITVDAQNITITWTKTGSPAGTAYILWEAE